MLNVLYFIWSLSLLVVISILFYHIDDYLESKGVNKKFHGVRLGLLTGMIFAILLAIIVKRYMIQ